MKTFLIPMFAVAFLLSFTLAPERAQALSCAAMTLEQHIEGADAIFAGKVTAIHSETSTARDYAEFEVSEYWKGSVTKEFAVGNIYAWDGTPGGSAFFEVGKTYLVYARSMPDSSKRMPNNLMALIDCSRTQSLATADEDLDALGDGKVPAEVAPTFTFTRNLTVGSTGEDVAKLQEFLIAKGFLVMPAKVVKGYFGGLTRAALARYQASVGIRPTGGYFGPLTRAHFNQLVAQ